MQYTENIDLLKPDQNEQYDIGHFNQNADTLDSHIHDLEVATGGMQAYIDAGDADSRKFSNMEGVCQISQGGTGKTTVQDAINALHGDVQAEGTLSDVDEFLFLRRTHEDVAQGISESLDTKSVLLDELAQKIFNIISGGSETPSAGSIFTPTTNGLAPKSGNNGETKFLNALGQWAEPQGRVDVITVTSSGSYDVGLNTVFRLQGNVTVLIRDPSIYMASIVFVNETAQAQLLSLRMKEGNVSYRINKGKVWRLSWTGSFWISTYEEPEVGALRPTYAVSAPDGWFMCNGRDTTGTADELETSFPNLYNLLGSNVLPDLRECALVGAGRNALDTIAVHDVYDLGEFKDDQIQSHTHTVSGFWGDGWIASIPTMSSNVLAMVNGGTNTKGTSASSGRSDSVTRGKRKGVNYIIKA